jgi:acyl transferase domain-containing protein
MVPVPESSGSGVAIVGVACRFPGAGDLESFWNLLRDGRDPIREIPAQRWNSAGFADALATRSARWAGILDQPELFAADFFQISPREAAQMDPQQRWLLEEAWHCVEDAGIGLAELRRATTAVYVGVMATDYRQVLQSENAPVESFSALGNYGAILANRISHCFGLRGESKTVDAACASALVALHDARRALLSGEADYALVGAANAICHPWKHASFERAHMLSPTGRCRTFSADADGYVPGEGAAVLLLQREADARRDRNRIHGLVRGSAVNHCGASLTITSPRISAQRDVIRAALQSANLPATALTYVEAHGTGTSLGDPIEVEALRQAFGATPEEFRCALGAVKTNVGHLEAAAGLAGVIKVLLMLRERMIPASLHLTEPNPVINFAATPFEPVTSAREWTTSPGETMRRAGVSSFGFGGVNAHVIIEEAPTTATAGTAVDGSVEGETSALPFVLSARSETALRDTVARWRAFAATPAFQRTNLGDLVATLATGREAFSWRAGTLVRSHDDVRRWLESAIGFTHHESPVKPGVFFGAGAELKSATAVAAHLQALGVQPAWTAGEGDGRWTALACAGAMSVEQAEQVRRGEQASGKISRPRWTCYRGDFQDAIALVEVSSAWLDEALRTDGTAGDDWKACFT